MKLKQKVHNETDMPIPRCWITDCRYTVALCGAGNHAMYQITAPGDKAPFAYTPNKGEVRNIIVLHKKANA